MAVFRHIRSVLAASLGLVGLSACAVEASGTEQLDITEIGYTRDVSIFRNPSLAAESSFYKEFGLQYDAVRLTVLRDFRTQTQIQASATRDEHRDAFYLETRFTSPLFGVESSEMQDGSTYVNSSVESYFLKITRDEFASIIEQLRLMTKVPRESSRREDDTACLHAAHVYFESIKSGKRVLVSRSGCDVDFDEAIFHATPLAEFAMKKLPSAAEDFYFVASLFDEIGKEINRGHD